MVRLTMSCMDCINLKAFMKLLFLFFFFAGHRACVRDGGGDCIRGFDGDDYRMLAIGPVYVMAVTKAVAYFSSFAINQERDPLSYVN